MAYVYVIAWFKAFVLTVLVELAVAVPLLRDQEPSPWRRAGLVAFAQLASHPAVWFIFPELRIGWNWIIGLAEAWAVLSETAYYALVFGALGARRAFGTSALANGASYGLGLLLRATTGWI